MICPVLKFQACTTKVKRPSLAISSAMHTISTCWFSYSVQVLQPHLLQTFKPTLPGVEVSLLLIPRICTVVYYHTAFSLTTAPLTIHPISISFSSYLSEERFMTTYRRIVCIWRSNGLNTCLKLVFISLHQTNFHVFTPEWHPTTSILTHLFNSHDTSPYSKERHAPFPFYPHALHLPVHDHLQTLLKQEGNI